MIRVEDLIWEIKKRYDRSNRDWFLMRGKDEHGHYDTFILGDRTLWYMKTEQKTPYQHIGIGTKINKPPDEVIEIIKREGQYFPIGEMYRKQGKSDIIAVGIGKYSSEDTSTLKSVLRGQEQLERKLNRELNKLLKKEHMLNEYV